MISVRSRPRCRPRAVAPASRGVSPTPRYSSPLCHCFHLATLHLGTTPDKEPKAKQIVMSCSPVNARTVPAVYCMFSKCFANCRVAALARTQQQYDACGCIRSDHILYILCVPHLSQLKNGAYRLETSHMKKLRCMYFVYFHMVKELRVGAHRLNHPYVGQITI